MSFRHVAVFLSSAFLGSACGDPPAESEARARSVFPADSLASPDGAPGPAVTAGAAIEPRGPVTVTGRVLDESTGEGLPGTYVIVLAPGVTFEEWERSPDGQVEGLMAGAALTDSVGRYEVPDLARGAEFTVVIAARGHEPAVFESGLTVRPDDPATTKLSDVRLAPR